MKRNAAIILVVALTVAAMIYSAAVKSRSAGANASVKGTTLVVGDVIGKPAPDFTLKTLDGKPVTLSELRGKAVLLNFWATWCGPCKIEMPWFIELEKRYQDQGLVIVGVAVDSENDEIAKFTKEIGVNYTILKGEEKVVDAYGGVDGLPTTFFVGRDGKIVESSLGLVSKGEIEDNIKKALATANAENISPQTPATTVAGAAASNAVASNAVALNTVEKKK